MNSLIHPQNHLFELAKTGQRLPHIIVALVMSFVFVLAAQLTGGTVAVFIVIALSIGSGQVTSEAIPEIFNSGDQQQILGLILPNTALEQTIFLILVFGPIFFLVWAWLVFFEKRPFWTIGLEWPGAVKKYIRGFLVGVVMFAASIAISAALGYIVFEEGGSQRQGLVALGGVLLVFIGWMVQGAAEEVITRGWLLAVIGARYKPILGVILSSLIFAVFHLINLNVSPIAVINLTLFGVFAALYTLYEGGLWGVFSIHTAWNWAQGNLFGFEVSGNPASGGTLLNLAEMGPDFITGGPFGPEGGLSVTVVLVVGCIVIWFLGAKQPQPKSEMVAES